MRRPRIYIYIYTGPGPKSCSPHPPYPNLTRANPRLPSDRMDFFEGVNAQTTPDLVSRPKGEAVSRSIQSSVQKGGGTKRKEIDPGLNQTDPRKNRKVSKTIFLGSKASEAGERETMTERVCQILCPTVLTEKIRRIMDKVDSQAKTRVGEYTHIPQITNDIKGTRKCRICKEVVNFVEDTKEASLVCTGCGGVQKIRQMHLGEWALGKTDDGVVRSQHGPAMNPLFSHGTNMRTIISRGGFSAHRARAQNSYSLRQSQQYMNLNVVGLKSSTRKTRIGYKDQMKQQAFGLMKHVQLSLKLHDQVIRRAQVYFASYRDLLEVMQQNNAVVAACIILATEKARERGAQRDRLDLFQVAQGPKGQRREPGWVRRRKKLCGKK